MFLSRTINISWIWKLSTLLVLMGIALLFLLTAFFVVPLLLSESFHNIFTWQWQPQNQEFGILPMLCASLLLAFSATFFSFPLALGICTRLYLDKKAQKASFFGHILHSLVTIMTAIPTVVYGFASLFLLTPLIRQGLGGSGLSWLTAAFALSFLILPTMVLLMNTSFDVQMQKLMPTTLALGFTPMQSLVYVGLGRMKETLISALILGFGRASGDTLLPLMLAGNSPQIPTSMLDSIRSLSAHMALVTANEVGSASYNSLFVAGALLLCLNACVSLGVRKINAKIKQKEMN